jgi:hypothetical protein
MPGSELPLLSSWQNFYMLIGTAAATLTGLMFVATTLIAGIDTRVSTLPTLHAGISAFSSPTVVHFCAVLLLAGILSAPWQEYSSLGWVLGGLGLVMVLYLLLVMRQMRRVPDYRVPLKDWLWYMALPLIGHVVVIGAAIALPVYPALALYLISGAMVALLLLGIHNAWDLVTYLAVERSHSEHKDPEQPHSGSSRRHDSWSGCGRPNR